jgi:hypothetical protein
MIHCSHMIGQDREGMVGEPAKQVRESPPTSQARIEERPLLRLARVLTLVGGLSVAFLGLLLGSLFTLASLLPGQETLVSAVTFGFSMVAVATGLGLAVAWQGLQAVLGRPSRPFHPRFAWPLALLFLLVLAAGQLILSHDLLPAATFPPFHVLAASLPPFFIVGLAGRALPGVTRWRDVILQLGAGALLATPLALVLEGTLLGVLALLATLSVALRPGGPELLEHLTRWLQTAPLLEDPQALLPLLLSPVIMAGITAIVAGAVPLLEEAVKTIGVLLMSYRRPDRRQALLWGMSGGAGFALVEGLLNSAAGLQAWVMVIVVRLGATLLHCVTGALMGLAWYGSMSAASPSTASGMCCPSVSLSCRNLLPARPHPD